MTCGYKKCVEALNFHHIHGKEYPLTASAFQKRLSKIVSEILRCVLLCPNCHAEDHAGVLSSRKLERAAAKVVRLVTPLKCSTWRRLGLPYW